MGTRKMDKERVVDRINKENRELYGDTCSKCDMYEHYCRCNKDENKKMSEKEREILLKYLWIILAMILWGAVMMSCKGQEVCPAYN